MQNYMLILRKILSPRRKTVDKITLQKQVRILADKHALNDEEIELVMLLLEGKSTKQIAFEQKLTLSTVEHRVNSIYRKCGTNSRSRLFAMLK